VRAYTYHLNTTTSQCRLMYNIFAFGAEFERDIIHGRTHHRRGKESIGLQD
jgi:DNA invertase Pin-like site-specific DNA recombinase